MDDQLRIPDSMVACVFKAPSHLSTHPHRPQDFRDEVSHPRLYFVHLTLRTPLLQLSYTTVHLWRHSRAKPLWICCCDANKRPLERARTQVQGWRRSHRDRQNRTTRSCSWVRVADGDDIAFKPSDIGIPYACCYYHALFRESFNKNNHLLGLDIRPSEFPSWYCEQSRGSLWKVWVAMSVGTGIKRLEHVSRWRKR